MLVVATLRFQESFSLSKLLKRNLSQTCLTSYNDEEELLVDHDVVKIAYHEEYMYYKKKDAVTRKVKCCSRFQGHPPRI
jgi:hypothetical protein